MPRKLSTIFTSDALPTHVVPSPVVTDGAPSGMDAAPHSNSPTRSAAGTFTRMIVETMGEGGGKPTFEWNEGLWAETPPLTPGRALMTPKPQYGNHFPSFG